MVSGLSRSLKGRETGGEKGKYMWGTVDARWTKSNPVWGQKDCAGGLKEMSVPRGKEGSSGYRGKKRHGNNYVECGAGRQNLLEKTGLSPSTAPRPIRDGKDLSQTMRSIPFLVRGGGKNDNHNQSRSDNKKSGLVTYC